MSILIVNFDDELLIDGDVLSMSIFRMIAPLFDRGNFASRDENCSELGFREGEEKRAGR